MAKVAHIIGNGDMAAMYKPSKGLKITCNVPPFEVNNIFATGIVDFKMCKAIHEGSVSPPAEWVCGFRPKIYSEKHPDWYMKHSYRIKEFYTVLPKYCMKPGENQGQGYTNFNCGHFVTHWAANKLQCDEIHMYGFDSIFDFTSRSFTDMILNSDRGNTNSLRLMDNWRPIWPKLFSEFSDKQFVLYHKHANAKEKLPENVEIRTKN